MAIGRALATRLAVQTRALALFLVLLCRSQCGVILIMVCGAFNRHRRKRGRRLLGQEPMLAEELLAHGLATGKEGACQGVGGATWALRVPLPLVAQHAQMQLE